MIKYYLINVYVWIPIHQILFISFKILFFHFLKQNIEWRLPHIAATNTYGSAIYCRYTEPQNIVVYEEAKPDTNPASRNSGSRVD